MPSRILHHPAKLFAAHGVGNQFGQKFVCVLYCLQHRDLDRANLLVRTVIDRDVESRPDMKRFTIQRLAELRAQRGGIQLRQRREGQQQTAQS